MKNFTILILMTFFCSQVHAGFFDWFGSDDEDATEQVSPPPSSDLVTQGLQMLPFLMQQLGITEGQASGGLGAILQTATSILSKGDSKSLLDAIPNATALLKAAPSIKQDTDEDNMLSGVMKTAGEYSDTAKAAANLSSQFESLGMGAQMIPKFVDATKSFLNKSDNSDAAALLTSSLSSLL